MDDRQKRHLDEIEKTAVLGMAKHLSGRDFLDWVKNQREIDNRLKDHFEQRTYEQWSEK